MNHFHFPVSFGTLLVSWNSDGLLSRIEWSEGCISGWQRIKIPSHLDSLILRIREYFDYGKPIGSFSLAQIDSSCWTPFQKEVYQTICEIPHGETRTYGWVAAKMGRFSASRAVGQALKKNTLPILIPCHRVLASASIGGFMGAIDPAQPQLQLKRRLLLLEDEYRSPVFSFLPPLSSALAFDRAQVL